jgi:hypothetical protein
VPGAQFRALFHNGQRHMNEWARRSERVPRAAADEFDRRVYGPEFCRILGCGTTWFRELQKCGIVTRGRRDPGRKREWWLASEVRAMHQKATGQAERAAA